MGKVDEIFKTNIVNILDNGCWDENPRPKYEDGEPAHTIFTTHVFETYDISKGEFPITPLRYIAWRSGVKEILWIYQDQSNDLKLLEDKYGIGWWKPWRVGKNDIGLRYGATVKKYNITNKTIKGLKDNPFGRRHIIDLFQYADFEETDGLYPCAYNFTLNVRKQYGELYLDGLLTQRSSDYLTAGHINKIQYTALLMMLAHECGYKVGKFSHSVACLHIYDRHLKQAVELLNRIPEPQTPILKLNAEGKGFYDITIDDFEMIDYKPVTPQLHFPLGI